MDAFNKSRLHTEAKESRRLEKTASKKVSSTNDKNSVNSVADTDDGYHDTYSSAEAIPQADNPSFDDATCVTDNDDTASSDEQSDNDDYTYYNPSDSDMERGMTLLICNFFYL